ncbi:c-type cytochrome [Aliishimia ponticola]|uniref:C-type cytochrome n=1 Tax=Aliishimia ponticola TaxID=2499833 RepID=A0A4V3XK76_9RHOB|nr:c-type cytochrome [Aliishimia ponticola]THH35893.1 c-type cytochrome [Aliishimia ponticola]
MKLTLIPFLAVLAAGPALADNFDEIKLQAGQALFEKECRRCHAVGSQDPSYGPPLENVVGRAAGSVVDYDYSIALEASGIVWTPAALRAWLEDNDGFMPGTKMRHVGIEDRTVQDFILFYLTSISDVAGNKAISD